MKKRIAALALVLAVLLGLAPASAADTVYFTAANDSLMELNESTMPFWSGGYLYVSAGLFGSAGVTYSRNTIRRTAVLYSSSRSLVFDLGKNTATDGQGNPYSFPALQRGAEIFLPVKPISDYFGLTYINLKVPHGYLIRVRGSGAVMPDDQFPDAAASLMEYRYNQYQRRLAGSGEPVSPPDSTDDPPSSSNRKTIYLCLEVPDAETGLEWLNALNGQSAQATFYFSEELLGRCGGLLRRLAAGGQGIGLLLDAPADRAGDQAAQMNRTLFEAAGCKTRLVKSAEPLSVSGLCPLQASVDRSAYGLSTYGGATNLLSRVSSQRASAAVWLGSGVTAGGLRAFLAASAAAGDRCAALTETSF